MNRFVTPPIRPIRSSASPEAGVGNTDRCQRDVIIISSRFADPVILTAGDHATTVIINPRVDRGRINDKRGELTASGIRSLHFAGVGIGQLGNAPGGIVLGRAGVGLARNR